MKNDDPGLVAENPLLKFWREQNLEYAVYRDHNGKVFQLNVMRENKLITVGYVDPANPRFITLYEEPVEGSNRKRDLNLTDAQDFAFSMWMMTSFKKHYPEAIVQYHGGVFPHPIEPK